MFDLGFWVQGVGFQRSRAQGLLLQVLGLRVREIPRIRSLGFKEYCFRV